MRAGNRRGFTLIEALVAVSIVSILFALTLNAVQSSLEASRRTRCAKNLQQLGLALQNYHSTYDSFPQNWNTYPSQMPVVYEIPRFFSAASRLLPYLDLAPLYSSINYSVEAFPIPGPFPYPANATVNDTTVNEFLCPSDPELWRFSHGNSYRGNIGVGPGIATTRETFDSGNGFFTYPGQTSSSSFPDGLSHTVAYSERLCGSASKNLKAPERNFGSLDPYPDSTQRDADYALSWCRVAGRTTFPAIINAGSTWLFSDRIHTIYCHAQEPNGVIPDALQTTTFWGISTARSWHRGGVNALMADGSTRFVSETINRGIWRALGTRNGGEIAE